MKRGAFIKRRTVSGTAARAARPVTVARPANSLVGRTLATDVLHRLRGDIIAGTLAPGAKLRFEALRSAYQVSFSTLREGLARLAAEGLVVADGQRGFIVAPVSIQGLEDVSNARVLVEREVMRLAIARSDEAWRERVFNAFQYMNHLPEQHSASPEWAVAHARFHAELASQCGSRILLEIRSNLFDHAHRYRRLAELHRSHEHDDPGVHREIMEAAMAGNVELACDLMERHMRSTGEDATAVTVSLAVSAAETWVEQGAGATYRLAAGAELRNWAADRQVRTGRALPVVAPASPTDVRCESRRDPDHACDHHDARPQTTPPTAPVRPE
jgi:DNA-binding GntR family transcriptional regulator